MIGTPTKVADPYGLLSPERSQNPYPFYARLLREAPVHFSEPWGTWVVTRYADVNAAFRDMRLSSVRTGMYSQGMPAEVARKMEPMARNMASWLLFHDAPSHTRLRSLINKAFTPRMVEALRPRIRSMVEELLDAVAGKERMEVISELANPLPVIVIGDMLGLPREDWYRLKQWSDKLASLIGTGRPTPEQVEGALGAILEFEDYFRPLIARRRTQPGSDLRSRGGTGGLRRAAAPLPANAGGARRHTGVGGQRGLPRAPLAAGGPRARGRHSMTVGCPAGVRPDREGHPTPSD